MGKRFVQEHISGLYSEHVELEARPHLPQYIRLEVRRAMVVAVVTKTLSSGHTCSGSIYGLEKIAALMGVIVQKNNSLSAPPELGVLQFQVYMGSGPEIAAATVVL